jgi:hypothetical protein
MNTPQRFLVKGEKVFSVYLGRMVTLTSDPIINLDTPYSPMTDSPTQCYYLAQYPGSMEYRLSAQNIRV